MPKITENLDVNAAGGDYVDVTCSIPCRKMTIEEDPNTGAGAKLSYKLASEGFAVTHLLEAGAQIELGNTIAEGNAFGTLLGGPAQNKPATPWAVGDTYDKGDTVYYTNGKAYISHVDGNIGNAPTANVIQPGCAVLPTTLWIEIVNYVPATVVAQLLSQGAATKYRKTEME